MTSDESPSQDGKILVVAEKPSVAADIARALGGLKKHKDHFESDEYIVSSAVGHLLELAEPEPKPKPGSKRKPAKWSFAGLPVLPKRFDLKPVEKTLPRLRALKKLFARKDVSMVINACDAGREGELIFYYLTEHFKARHTVKRLWLQSMTPAAIREGFERLRPGEDMTPLREAAVCRSESDWLVGINATRAMTAFNSRGGGFRLTTVGRVQTPTLALLVERERQIRAFVPKDYWEVTVDFTASAGTYTGTWIAEDAKESQGKDRHRIWEQSRAEEIAEKCRGGEGAVTETRRQEKVSPPALFHLTSLQREANSRFGLPARATLGAAQALYERHKALTYPRTDSRALPSDYVSVVGETLAKLAATRGERALEADLAQWSGKTVGLVASAGKRVFNDAKVSDHFAIIPTGEVPASLPEDSLEAKIYDLVTRRFVATFHPPAEYEATRRLTEVAGETFETRGRILRSAGWQAVAKKTAGDEEPLCPVADGESVRSGEPEVEANQTKPPRRLTEATLLTAMESAGKLVEDDDLREAMSERGLGTPATRAGIIETLIRQQYVVREQRELIPTARADALLEMLSAAKVDELTAPELTGEWEYKLRQIERAEHSPESFLGGIRDLTERLVVSVEKLDPEESAGSGEEVAVACPKCGATGAMRRIPGRYVCGECKFFMRSDVAGRELSREEALELLSRKEIGPVDGLRSRKGALFSASLALNDEHIIEFRFPDAAADDEEPLGEAGKCPKCAGVVHILASSYACEQGWGDKPSCDFKLSRVILRRAIALEEAQALLQDGKTALLAGFVSRRTGRPFSAHLTLDSAGKLGFEFAPRKKKPAKKKAAKKPAKKKAAAKS